MKKWILVIDSGIGGLWTLNKIREVLPNENYLFFMDKTNSPYGNKSEKKLKQISFDIISKMIKIFDVKLIVIACNTLSITCTDFLKEKFFYMPIINILPYTNSSHLVNKPTLVLATYRSIKSSKKIKELKKNKNVYVLGFKTLAKKIDNANGEFKILQKYLDKKLKKFRKKNIKNVVLGCTHFNFIKSQIINALTYDVNFFENSKIVSKKVKNILKATNRLSKSKKIGQVFKIYKI